MRALSNLDRRRHCCTICCKKRTRNTSKQHWAGRLQCIISQKVLEGWLGTRACGLDTVVPHVRTDRLSMTRCALHEPAVVHHEVTVDEHVGDAGGGRGWLLECSVVRDALGIEDADVCVTPLLYASLSLERGGDPLQPPSRTQGHLVDGIHERERPPLADIHAQRAAEGTRAPRVSPALVVEGDGVRGHEAPGMPHTEIDALLRDGVHADQTALGALRPEVRLVFEAFACLEPLNVLVADTKP